MRRDSVPPEGASQQDESGSRHKLPPLPPAASTSGSACRELPGQVPGTKPKEAFWAGSCLHGQAGGLWARSWEAPRCPQACWYLEMFLNVLPVVGDAAGRDAGLPHQLETDLPAQVVRDVPLLAREKQSWVKRGWESPAGRK